ncbi:BLUF domain-containing protein [Stenotrophomonas maltophilia]|uniref:BLUF domain-containing protein n=1 Tax=Stenotrophomonas maltophilia TaxID=40324 RepID=UPI0039C3AE46
MPIKAVVYVSEAGPAFAGDVREAGGDRLQLLIGDASRFNCNAGITGVLLFDGGRFLQYLEGPDDGVDVAYSRVVGATSHSGLVELQRGGLVSAGSLSGRCVGYWSAQTN